MNEEKSKKCIKKDKFNFKVDIPKSFLT